MKIMDVDPEQVRRLMKQNQSTLLIHGHTHRPDIHEIEDGNKRHRRVVLGDWCDPNPYLFLAQTSGQRLIRADEYLKKIKN